MLKVDYAAGHKIMKFGDVGIKIYVVYRTKLVSCYYKQAFFIKYHHDSPTTMQQLAI